MAIDLTGIQNVGEFYSYHYLDALLDRDLRGLFDKWRLSDDNEDEDPDTDTPDRRFNRCATDYFKAKSAALNLQRLVSRYQPTHALHVQLLEALGFSYLPDVHYLLDGTAVPTLCQVKRDGRLYLTIVETVFTDPDESPLENKLLREQYLVKDGPGAPERPREPWEDVLGELFRVAEPPRWVLFMSGRFIYLLDRTKWGQGQYLLFDLDEIFGRRQRATLRATAALLSRDALAPDDGVPLHDTLDENSHKHAYGVSTDLKYGVRKSVELLANEYVWYQRNIGKQALFTDSRLAHELTRECLTYLYRLLFLFYAEARSSELELVPMNAEAYRTGYSLEALRDLEQVPLNTPRAQEGYYIHESLNQLYRLVNEGFPEFVVQGELSAAGPIVYDNYGFTIAGLSSPLFERQVTPRLSSAKFRNILLQEVLQLLSLSKEGRGRNSNRGRISYAQLGINQLGAVYEGLLSYSGFFAQEPLYEVKPASVKQGDEMDQTYFIPESDLERYEEDEFVYESDPDGTRRRKQYPRGSFIFRLAGRDREKSASYYTPEVLTECVVKYSLKELLGESPGDPNWKTADEILRLTLCEPAMGSGAFINEGINQLADAYLQRKQTEMGETLAPDEYRKERQKVKAYLALHNAYGVDLNPMATELAQVSIWLNIIYPGMPAPWFNARLSVGNSLIGARRQVYSAEDVLSGEYSNKAPTPIPLSEPRPKGSVYHWLLPDKGMAAFDTDKVIKELAPKEVQAIKEWRKGFIKKIGKEELKQLQALSDAADDLWQRHVRGRMTLLEETRTPIEVWGQPKPAAGNGQVSGMSVEAKQKRLDHLNRSSSPFRRLKLAMDYWCALWFWPILEAGSLPTRQDFLADMAALLIGPEHKFERTPEQMSWLDDPKPRQQNLAEVPLINVDALVEQNGRLTTVAEVGRSNRFLHWELIFAELFFQRGGFDLIVGNPPWVKLSWNERGVLSDFEPLLAIRGYSASDVAKKRWGYLGIDRCSAVYLREFGEADGTQAYLNSSQNYELLRGVQTNLYKCFIVRAWDIGNSKGIVGLLHPEGIYDDSRGGYFRAEIYQRLKAHYMFQNELKLFAEIGNRNRYSVNVYQPYPAKNVNFVHMVNLYHPSTVDSSYTHDGVGKTPGIKNSENNWDLKGHRHRILMLGATQLAILGQVFEEGSAPPLHTRLPLIHSQQLLSVLEKFAKQPRRLADLAGEYFTCEMWHETNAQKDGTIHRTCSIPKNVNDWILSGPHFYVATPFYQTPDKGCKSHRAYSRLTLTTIPTDYLPRTVYTPACSPAEYAKRTPTWKKEKVTDSFRHVHRTMLSEAGERTLVNAIAPQGPGMIDNVFSISFASRSILIMFSGLCSSLPYDFYVKSGGKGHLRADLVALFPFPLMDKIEKKFIVRVLRLNCLTIHYRALWEALFDNAFKQDTWSRPDTRLSAWEKLTPIWQKDNPLRSEFERRQALVEIDVLASMVLGLTLDELLTIYRVQFPVLQQNEQRLLFDQRGFVVPVRTVRGELVDKEDDPSFPDMVPPFTSVDREADYRQAWSHFEHRFKSEPIGK